MICALAIMNIDGDLLPPNVRAACDSGTPIPLQMTRTVPVVGSRPRSNDAVLALARREVGGDTHSNAALLEAAIRATRHDAPTALPPVDFGALAPVVSSSTRFCERRIQNVYLCFFASEGVTSNSWFTSMAYWSVGWLRETYAHVEVLFKFDGNDSSAYQVLTVSEKTPSGLFKRDINHYRLGRWKLLRLDNLTDRKRAALYDFARRENRQPRSYKYASAVSTTPVLNLCMPVITYTPGCTACLPSGPDTVFCVQLVMEMLKQIYANELSDVDASALRADQLFHLVEDRIPVAESILSFETGDIQRILQDTLRSGGGS